MDIEKRIIELRDTLKQHEYNLHILGEPSISDFEFEELMLELRELENEQKNATTLKQPDKVFQINE